MIQKCTEKKLKGSVYTPLYMVQNILNISGYTGNNILQKHVIDNSCGDGAFLVEVVRRYCETALKNNYDLDTIKDELELYIHGIEIDNLECQKCIENMSKVAKEFGISSVDWDVINADTLTIDKFNNKMDFVIGNPPYIRVHNLGKNVNKIKQFSFAKNGMTDLFLVFYEIGLKMLKDTGILGYITPSSFFNSVAGSYMRKQLVENQYLNKVVDLKHFQVFNATTYTAIVVLTKTKNEKIEYYQFDEKKLIPYYVETLNKDDYYIANNFYFSTKKNLQLLKKIFNNFGRCDVQVKNGYATLSDDVFVGEFNFESKYVIPVLKASKGEWKEIIYPYNIDGKLIAETEIKDDKNLYQCLVPQKQKLLQRSIENNNDDSWFAFGRSQGIKDTYKDKLALNTLLRTVNDLKLIDVRSGKGVYSGLYIVSTKTDLSLIKSILKSEEFVNYVSLLGKYKSGGYYTFSSKDVKAFVDYKLAYNGGLLEYEQ